jgi:enamine deaminase RidA (YjgF/YER057c/UK114 family)
MINRIEQGSRMSQAVAFGGFFETAGQVAKDTSLDVAAQTQQALDEIERLLAAANLTRDNLTRIQIWLADNRDRAEMNRVYDRWIEGFGKPVRACVESKLSTPGYLVEIQAFAYRAD